MATILNVTAAEYLADPAPQPSLSSSIANVLIDQSPVHAWLRHPRLGGKPAAGTDATDRGTLIHALVLDKGPMIEVVKARDWRTKAAKDARAAAALAGHVAVLEHTFEFARLAAVNIVNNLRDRGVVLTGQSEQVILWQEEASAGPIWCRGMLDHVIADGMLTIYDLKSCQSAHPEQCMRSAIRYGYDMQAEAYTRAAEMAWPEYAGRVQFRFLFVECDPPYAVTVAGLDALMEERGARRWRAAVETWSRCLATNTWPGYAREPVTLCSPSWLLYQESEAAAARGEEFVYER